MPLHLDSIIPESQQDEVIRWILTDGFQEANDLIVSSDKKHFHLKTSIYNSNQEEIGCIVYTLLLNAKEERNDLLDLDIIWKGSNSIVQFLGMLPGSSDSNEYYEASTISPEQHFELETVGRYVTCEELANTNRDVRLSAFPFQVGVFEDIAAYNQWAGFGDGIQLGTSEIMISGYAEDFMMPGYAASLGQSLEEHFTFLIGQVLSFQDIQISFGEQTINIVIATIQTGLGKIPVAMNRECFDLTGLQEGCILALSADIKAYLCKDTDWISLSADADDENC